MKWIHTKSAKLNPPFSIQYNGGFHYRSTHPTLKGTSKAKALDSKMPIV